MRKIMLLLFCFGVTSVAADAQWLDYKNPKVPRTADGKPNLKAPAPKLPDGTPDLSGIWAAPEREISGEPWRRWHRDRDAALGGAALQRTRCQ